MPDRTRVTAALLLVFGGGIALAPTSADAQQTTDAQKLDRVEITGSSIKRIEGETALPVQIISREEIQRTGASTVEQLLQTVSSNASSGLLAAAANAGSTTLGLSSISLRGLSSLRTLVLINGRRVSPYGYGFTNDSVSVDVNSIPVAAIERVEILKDGASAVYGSDAIAGVVNFILRKDFQGLEVSGEYGAARSGSASVTRANAVYGFGDIGKDRFNVMALVSYQKEDSLFGRDRRFARTNYTPEAIGVLNDTSSGNTFPANIVAADGSFGTRNPSFPTCPGPFAVRSPIFDTIGYRGCRFDPSELVTLIPDTERIGFFASGKLQVTSTMDAFGEASFSRNKQRTVIQPSPISDQFTIPLNNPLANEFPYNAFTGGEPTVGGLPYSTILLRPTSPYYPTAFVQSLTGGATPELLVRWRAAVLGNRDLEDISDATRLMSGLRGSAAGWDYEAALLYSGSKISERTKDGYVRITQVMPLLNSGNVNFFGPNTAATQALLNATKHIGESLATNTSLASLSGKATRELTQMAGGPLALATGAEIRRENYQLNPSEALITGDLTGYGGNFIPVDRSRTVRAVFAELNAPVMRSLEINAAVRYDDYEGVGSSTNPKLGVRWSPTRQVLVRGSIGKGFRAPSLLDLYAPRTTGVTPPGLSDPLRCDTTGSTLDCNTQFPVTNGGLSTLKPEKSTNATLGVVLEPVNNVSVALDYFNIKLKETINNGIPAATILSDPVKYNSLITRGPVQPSFPNLPGPIIDIDATNLNLGETKLSGFDLDAKWAIPTTSLGRWTFGLNATYYSKYDVQNPDKSFSTAIDTANNSTGGVIPRWRHYASVSWSYAALTLTLAQTWQGSYNDLPASFDDPTDPAFVPRRVGSYETYDLQASYAGIKNLTLTFGVKNLFDRDPPYSNIGGNIYFQTGYDPGYVDPRGRFFYGRVTYAFK